MLNAPNQRFDPIAFWDAAVVSFAASTIEVGIGVPSKYFTLPLPSESASGSFDAADAALSAVAVVPGEYQDDRQTDHQCEERDLL